MALPKPPDGETKSELRKIAEHKIKQASRKQVKKYAKKAAKKVAKLAAKAVQKGSAVLAKMLLSFLASIGWPAILITFGILILLVIIFLLSSVSFGNGQELDSQSQKLYEYMENRAYSTVDMSRSEQVPYRVPIQLIASAIQLTSSSQIIETTDDAKTIIRTMTNELAPTFEYNQFNEWKEKQVTVCEDGVCNEGPVKRIDNFVDKLTFINAWNGQTTITYEERIKPWVTQEKITYRTETYTVTEEYTETEIQPFTVTKEKDGEVTKTREVEKEREIEVKTITKTRRRVFDGDSNHVEGYSALDQVLNLYGYGLQDKQLVEAFYQASAEAAELPLPPINYTNWLNSIGFGSSGVGIGFDGIVIPGAGVPAQYMEYYLSAEKKYGVDWFILAAIHFTETGFSTHPTMVSSVGAIGPMQFIPATWAGWSYNTGGGLISPSIDITDLDVIRAGNGYGVDANGDGKADPWNIEDAIYSAANYLSNNGYSTDQRKAIYTYNRAEWYVNKVLATASGFRDAAVYKPANGMPVVTDGTFTKPTNGYVTSPYGMRSGGMHQGIDIGNNGISTPIVSVADGTVSRSYFSNSYGNVVFIKHSIDGKNYETVYAHMANRAVSTGDKVNKGQFIGMMGSTGNSTGIHIHFEIHRGEWTYSKVNALNPALYIPF